jgi:D-alanyl-D-alanine carboxypeptidase
MYTLQATDIDNGGEFFRKLNANFAEAANPQSSHTDAECRTRFIAEMNKKAVLLGMTGTTFYDPAGNQPIGQLDYNHTTYPNAWESANANVMTAMDALRLLIYASGVQHINDAWNIQSFTLNYRNGTTSKTATINSTVFISSTYQSSINALLADYDILGGKTGSWGYAPLNAHTLVIVARSKTTGKVYAATNFSTTTSATSSNNKFIEIKKALDYVDASGASPSFSKGGCCVTELPVITPSLLNYADIALAYAYGKDTNSYPASVSKVMTAILLNDNVLDLNQKVTVHESDRQPPTGTNFVAGDVLTLRDLLQCMLMESSNTSAQVIARVVGGILLDNDANVLE